MIYKKKNEGQWAKCFKEFKWIKPEDSENLINIPKHDKRTSFEITLDICYLKAITYFIFKLKLMLLLWRLSQNI